MNVKTAAFADIEDESFDNDTKLHKELLGKIPTVADPYIICPPTLRKLMHQYHPRGECQIIPLWVAKQLRNICQQHTRLQWTRFKKCITLPFSPFFFAKHPLSALWR